MSERSEFVHKVVDELRILKGQPPFEPAADIDMVWVLSAPGTVKEVSDDGIYNGISADLKMVRHGIEFVKQITADRLGKATSDVTKADIRNFGPVLFYNGEDKDTENYNYLQNEHLEEMVGEPDFPIPRSKIIIDHIDTIGTPAQVEGIADYLQKTGFAGKIAVVSMVHHSVRVSRYLEKYKDLFPRDVELVNAAIGETENPLGKTF